MRRHPVALLALAAMVLLSACSAGGNRRDARVREVLVVDRNDVGLLVGDAVVDTHVPRVATIGPLPAWARASNVTIGDYDGVAIEILHDGPLELQERLAATHQLLAHAGGRDVDVQVQYGPIDGGWRLVLRSVEKNGGPRSPMGPSLGPDPLEVYRSAILRLSVDLPGRIVAHNASATDGDLLAWDLSLAGGQAEVFAISAPVATTSLTTPGALVVGATIAATAGGLIVFGFVVLRSRRPAVLEPAPATSPGGVSHHPPGLTRHWPSAPPPTPPGPKRPPGPP